MNIYLSREQQYLRRSRVNSRYVAYAVNFAVNIARPLGTDIYSVELVILPVRVSKWLKHHQTVTMLWLLSFTLLCFHLSSITDYLKDHRRLPDLFVSVLLYWVLVLVLVLVRKYLLPIRIFSTVSDTHLCLSDQGFIQAPFGGDFGASPKKFWPGL